jgi:hypothetical protein
MGHRTCVQKIVSLRYIQDSGAWLIVLLAGFKKGGRAWESCTRCVPVKDCPALFKANFPYLRGIRNVYYSHPRPDYAFAVYIVTLK